jgi:hypothetical protein
MEMSYMVVLKMDESSFPHHSRLLRTRISIAPECGKSTRYQPIVAQHMPNQDRLTNASVLYLVKATPDTAKSSWRQSPFQS